MTVLNLFFFCFLVLLPKDLTDNRTTVDLSHKDCCAVSIYHIGIETGVGSDSGHRYGESKFSWKLKF